MCYFLAVGVQAAGAGRLATERARRHRGGHLTISPASNASLVTLFPRGDRLFWVTYGMCSCDLCLGSSSRRHVDSNRERKRYEERGWSEAKIARALEAKQAERPTVARGQRDHTPRELLRDLLSDLSVCDGGVRVFARSYSGDQDSEQVTGHIGGQIDVRDLIDGGDFPQHTVIDIARSHGTTVGRSS